MRGYLVATYSPLSTSGRYDKSYCPSRCTRFRAVFYSQLPTTSTSRTLKLHLRVHERRRVSMKPKYDCGRYEGPSLTGGKGNPTSSSCLTISGGGSAWSAMSQNILMWPMSREAVTCTTCVNFRRRNITVHSGAGYRTSGTRLTKTTTNPTADQNDALTVRHKMCNCSEKKVRVRPYKKILKRAQQRISTLLAPALI